LLIRHKLNLKSGSKIDSLDLLVDYVTQFKEVASLVFDMGVYLINLPQASADKLISLYEEFLAVEKDDLRICRLKLNKFKLK